MSEKRKMYMLIVSGRMRQLEKAIVQVNICRRRHVCRNCRRYSFGVVW